jgi:hypothetical protein
LRIYARQNISIIIIRAHSLSLGNFSFLGSNRFLTDLKGEKEAKASKNSQ